MRLYPFQPPAGLIDEVVTEQTRALLSDPDDCFPALLRLHGNLCQAYQQRQQLGKRETMVTVDSAPRGPPLLPGYAANFQITFSTQVRGFFKTRWW